MLVLLSQELLMHQRYLLLLGHFKVSAGRKVP